MITVAVIIDVTQFFLTLIPFLGWFLEFCLGIFAWVLFSIWCSHYGVSLYSSKRALGTIGTIVAEVVPFIDAAPWWTINIAYTVTSEWRAHPTI